MPIANTAAQRARVRTRERRRDHGRIAGSSGGSCNSVMKQVVSRAVSRPEGGTSVTARRRTAKDSLRPNPEASMKTGESAWVVRVARLQATKVRHAPFFVPELAHRWTNRRRRRRRRRR